MKWRKKKEYIEKKHYYLNKLLFGSADDIKKLRCPICDSKIRAGYHVGKTRVGNSGQLRCKNCLPYLMVDCESKRFKGVWRRHHRRAR